MLKSGNDALFNVLYQVLSSVVFEVCLGLLCDVDRSIREIKILVINFCRGIIFSIAIYFDKFLGVADFPATTAVEIS